MSEYFSPRRRIRCVVESIAGFGREGTYSGKDRSAEEGNFGDCKPVSKGISEMRVHSGPGYRIYYCRKGEIVYLLLCGGDKSTQTKDIKRAKAILKSIEG